MEYVRGSQHPKLRSWDDDIVTAVYSELGGDKGRIVAFCEHLESKPASCRPGGKSEPKTWGWFRAAAKNFMQAPPGNIANQLAPEKFAEMTKAIELDLDKDVPW